MTRLDPTDLELDRAGRLGRLAAQSGRGLGGACPYDANGSVGQRLLALRFVRQYVAHGGTVDGMDYGDGAATSTRTRAPRSSSTSTRAPRSSSTSTRAPRSSSTGVPLYPGFPS